jgi:cold shock protein
MATQLDRIERMLAALCDHLGVQDLNQKSIPETPNALGVDNGHRYLGTVSRFEHGWGFIECNELGRNFFVHYSDVEGTGLRLLEAGEEVSFEIGPGKDGRPKAVRVRRQRTAQEQTLVEAAPRPETVADDRSPTKIEEATDEEDDIPQPEPSEVLPSRLTPRRISTRRTRLGALSGRRPAISW